MNEINEQTIKVMLLYVSVGMKVLSARIVLLLTLVLVFTLFCWAMWDPSWNRIACATIFAVLIFLPATRIDHAQAKDRAVISPGESSDS